MLTPRRKTRQIRIGNVPIGGDAPISVQSMTTTKTADINATLQQIASLVAAGVDIVRVAVPHWEDAEALTAIAAKSTVPVVADIHFQWKYAMAALEAGIQGLRINPGNIKYQDKVRLIAREAKDRGVPIRIGVNAGSLEKDLLEKYGAPTPEALVESALNEARILEDEDFFDIKISVKHSNPRVMIESYRHALREVRLPAAPRRHRGGPDADGRRQERRRHRGAPGRGHRRHDPRLAHRRSGRGGEDRHVDPAVARSAQAWPRPRGVPVVRPRRGRRARPHEAGERGARAGGPQGADPRGGDGLRGERARARLARPIWASRPGKGQGFLLVKGEVVDKIPEDQFVTRLIAEAKKLEAAAALEPVES